MKSIFFALVLLFHAASFAHCPNPVACEIKYVDQAFQKTKLTGEDLEKAKAMRDQGEKLYKEGEEDEALKLLKETKKFLLEGVAKN